MDDPSLPYSLFLFNEFLDPKKKPDIWVMVRAWYGILSTGGQAGFALDKLTEMMAEEFPKAYKPLRENREIEKTSFVLHFICPTNHLSYTSFVLNIICPTLKGKHHLSYTSFVLH